MKGAKAAAIFAPIANAFMLRGQEPKKATKHLSDLHQSDHDEVAHVFLAESKKMRDRWIQLINTRTEEAFGIGEGHVAAEGQCVNHDRLEALMQVQEESGYKPK